DRGSVSHEKIISFSLKYGEIAFFSILMICDRYFSSSTGKMEREYRACRIIEPRTRGISIPPDSQAGERIRTEKTVIEKDLYTRCSGRNRKRAHSKAKFNHCIEISQQFSFEAQMIASHRPMEKKGFCIEVRDSVERALSKPGAERACFEWLRVWLGRIEICFRSARLDLGIGEWQAA